MNILEKVLYLCYKCIEVYVNFDTIINKINKILFSTRCAKHVVLHHNTSGNTNGFFLTAGNERKLHMLRKGGKISIILV